MTQIKNYNYSEKEISVVLVDTLNSEYLWIAFKQDANGNCALQKVSAHNPLQKYFNIDLTTNEIRAGCILGSYLYLALDDSLLIGKRYSLSNPLTSYTNFSIPIGIDEKPIDISAYGSYVYFLLPGNISGQNAKICKFTLTGTFVETIDLTTVTNAKSFTIDENTGDLWVVTYEFFAKYIRVYYDSGWNYTINT